MRMRAARVFAAIVAIALAGCGGGSLQNSNNSGGGGGGTLPAADHVFLVVLENHSFAQVIGNPVMPYLNSLAGGNSLATNYFADIHPSIGNYFMLSTGQIINANDAFNGVVTDDNLARALAGAGKSWKAYMESIPSAGYVGPDVLPYVKHHNPFSFFSDVAGSDGTHPTALAANIVPFPQLAADTGANALPNFGFIVPNLDNDAHDCPGGGSNCADSDKLAVADTWLKNNIDPLIKSPAFAKSVLIITFDEGQITDLANVGGQVATVLVGTHVKMGFKSTTMYQHQSTLRLILDLLKVGDRPGLSATAPSMNEFFQ